MCLNAIEGHSVALHTGLRFADMSDGMLLENGLSTRLQGQMVYADVIYSRS